MAMPETESSGHTAPMNARLKVLLRRTALELRALVAEGACEEEINEVRDAALADVWRILVICLGEPPASFEWEWRDDAGEFHRDGILTPREFYERYVDVDLTQYVCLVDDPRTCHPKGHTLTVDYMGNVVGGRPILYVNAPIRQIRAITTSVLTSGRAVWFGADCHPNSDRASGLFVEPRDAFHGRRRKRGRGGTPLPCGKLVERGAWRQRILHDGCPLVRRKRL